MSLKSYLKNLEKRKIISRKPHPLIPFILTGVVLALYIYSIPLNKNLAFLSFILMIFAFVFSIIHYIIFKILKS